MKDDAEKSSPDPLRESTAKLLSDWREGKYLEIGAVPAVRTLILEP